MKNYTIKSNYQFEIEANNNEEALEKWLESIEDYYSYSNQDLLSVFIESLFAKLSRKKK